MPSSFPYESLLCARAMTKASSRDTATHDGIRQGSNEALGARPASQTWKSLAGLAQRLRGQAAPRHRPPIPEGEEGIGLLRQVIDGLPHQVSVRDPQGRFLLANRALARRYGLRPDQIEGRTESDLSAA